MKEITSRSNPLWRDWMHQRSTAGRPGNLIWLDGPHLCQAWLTKHTQPLWAIFDASKVDLPHVSAFISQTDSTHQVLLTHTLFEQLGSVTASQGVLFLVEHASTHSFRNLPNLSDLPDLPDSQLDIGSKNQSLSVNAFKFDRAVLLDSIQDPGNVGTILRLSAAAGVTHVILGPGCAAAWSPKVLRSAQGAHFALTLLEVDDAMAWLESYRQHTNQPVPVLATAVANAKSLWSTELPKRSIWLFGHEGQGVNPELLAMADIKIKIEHDQTVVDSLNVASAAAICLFEQSRQHRD
jgi:TrmH family RNA methyltransferase